jgi:hypothetical protein
MKKKVTKTTTEYTFDDKSNLIKRVETVEEYEVNEEKAVLKEDINVGSGIKVDNDGGTILTGTIKSKPFNVAKGVPYATFDASGNTGLYGNVKGIDVSESVALAILDALQKLDSMNTLKSNKPF